MKGSPLIGKLPPSNRRASQQVEVVEDEGEDWQDDEAILALVLGNHLLLLS